VACLLKPNGTRRAMRQMSPKRAIGAPGLRDARSNHMIRLGLEQALQINIRRGLVRDFQPVFLDFGMICFNVLICYICKSNTLAILFPLHVSLVRLLLPAPRVLGLPKF
jgi:hypothetical protein